MDRISSIEAAADRNGPRDGAALELCSTDAKLSTSSF